MFNACKLLGRDFHASQYRLAYLVCKLVLTRPSSEHRAQQEISNNVLE